MNSMNILFKKTLGRRVKRIHRILKKDHQRSLSGKGPKQEIFDNFSKFLSAFADKGSGNLDIFPLTGPRKKGKGYSKEIKSKLLKIKNYLHLSKDPSSCPID